MKKKTKEEKVEPRMKPLEIHLPVYAMTVIVFVDHSPEEIKKLAIKRGVNVEAFTKDWMRGCEDAGNEAGGYCTTIGEKNRDVLVWVKKRPRTAREFGTLYHELYHAVDQIFFDIDRHSLGYAKDGHSEPRAYLYQFLVNKCNNALWT